MNAKTMNSIKIEHIISKLGYTENLSKSMKCLFPEHKDKNPSAGISEKLNAYCCGVCGTFNPINFVMNELGCSVSDALKWGEDNFGHKNPDDRIYFTIPKDEADEPLTKPNHKVYQKIMDNGKLFDNDYRGIKKELLNLLGIRQGFRGYDPMDRTKDDKLLKVLKTCGVITLDKNKNDYFILKGYDIYIPYFKDGELVNIQGNRHYNPDWRRYMLLSGVERPLFNYDIMKDMKDGEDLWVVEGAFDCLSLLGMGLKAVGLAGAKGSFQKYQDLFKRFTIKTILDNDEAGKTLGKEMIESGLDVEVYKWKRDGKYDINDFIIDNQGAGLNDLLGQVERYRAAGDNAPETIVEGNKMNKMKEIIENHFKACQLRKKGELSGFALNDYPYFEKEFDGISKGLYTIGGNTTIGKTGFLINFMLSLLESNEGLKAIYFSIDDSKEKILDRIYARIGNIDLIDVYKRTYDSNIEGSKLDTKELLLKWSDERRFILYDSEDLIELDKITVMVEKDRSEKMVIFIDGANYLSTKSRDSLDKDKEISNGLKNISNHFQCPLFATVEVRKNPNPPKNGSPEDLAKRSINLDDFKGSNSLTYRSDVSIALRPREDGWDDSSIPELEYEAYVLKNKISKGKGIFYFRFHKYHSLLKEIDEEGRERIKKKKKEKAQAKRDKTQLKKEIESFDIDKETI